jgi:hypothetical protein
MRHEFRTLVRGYMRRNFMLGEDMDDKKLGQLGRGDNIVSRNEVGHATSQPAGQPAPDPQVFLN